MPVRASSEPRPDRPLRILMTIHTPWERELGAPRVQMELGEELTAMVDRVEKLNPVALRWVNCQ